MYGATPYIQENFDFDEKVAGQALIAWMEQFSN